MDTILKLNLLGVIMGVPQWGRLGILGLYVQFAGVSLLVAVLSYQIKHKI